MANEGWGTKRPGDKVSHYYRAGSALCGMVTLYRGDLDAETGSPGPDDCSACAKRLDDVGLPTLSPALQQYAADRKPEPDKSEPKPAAKPKRTRKGTTKGASK